MSRTIHAGSRLSVRSVRWRIEFVVAFVIGSAAVALVGGQADIAPGYFHVGEGLSSAAPGDDAEFASFRMFTIYELDEACRRSRAGDVVRLRARRSRLMLHVGEPFSPGSLRVAALDAAGTLLPRVPIAIELNSTFGVFDARYPWGQSGQLRANELLTDGALMPLRPERVTFRFRTICPGPAADLFVDAEIGPR